METIQELEQEAKNLQDEVSRLNQQQVNLRNDIHDMKTKASEAAEKIVKNNKNQWTWQNCHA